MFDPRGPSLFELIRQGLASTERGYDLLAPKFDHTPFRAPDTVLDAVAHVVGDVDAALDLCCGTGAVLRVLRPRCRTRAVGLDFSRGMLDEARRRLGDAPGTAPIELVHGDAFELAYDRAFDVVTCVGALGHVRPADEDRFVAGIWRALRPGGRFVFATAAPPPPTELAFWLAHGFNAVMHVRNALIRPPFVMFYLTFTWPGVRALLERHGFAVGVHARLCAPPHERVLIVSARRTG